ncbi:MAG: hypothetical protein ACYDCL_23370 [Myxococcales bacterium]
MTRLLPVSLVALLACGRPSPPVPGTGGTHGRTRGTSGTAGTSGSSVTSGSSGGSSSGSTGTGGSSGSSSSGGSGGNAGCSVTWQGASRTFGPPVALSTDPASSIVAPVFLPPSTARAVVFEPSIPELALADPTGQTGPQRLDNATFPAAAGSTVVQQPFDASSALVVLGSGSAVSFVSSDGNAHGPFSLGQAGLTSLLSSLPLEGGTGALLLGQGASGLGWTTVGASSPPPLTVFPLGISGVQSSTAALWDDGQGGVWALLDVVYGSGTALLVAHGGGTPFSFAQPKRLDTLDPGGLAGFEAALGPTGQLGVLLVEGSSASPSLAGYAVSTAGSLTGGLIATLPAALTLPSSPAVTPWSVVCGAQGSCDPTVRFDAAGDLLAAWTLSGKLNLARLPAGTSAWPSFQQIVGGPLASALAVDSTGDASALTGTSPTYSVLAVPASGAPTLTPLNIQVANPVLAAATSNGSGAFWGLSPSEPSQILGWSYVAAGNPSEGSPLVLPGGETAGALRLSTAPAAGAGPTALELAYPSAVGPSFSGVAGPGWAALTGSLGSAGDLLLSSYDPSAAQLGAPVSVALSGWQSSAGATFADLQVDAAGVALVAFAQPLGGSAPDLYLASAAQNATPSLACSPLPLLSAGSGTGVKLTFATDLLAGGTAVFCGRDAPATAALAR